MSRPGSFETLLAEIGLALVPLRSALTSPQSCAGLLRELGWHAPEIPQPLAALRPGVDTLAETLRGLTDGGFGADDVPRVLGALQALVGGIRAITGAPDEAVPEHLRADGFREHFPKQLLDHLVIGHLQRHRPSLGFALRALGVVRTRYVPPAGNRPGHHHHSLDLADLPRALTDPAAVLRDAHGWGGPGFAYDEFADQLDSLLLSLGASTTRGPADEWTAQSVHGTQRQPADPPVPVLRAVLLEHPDGEAGEAGEAETAAVVRMLELPPEGDRPGGLALLPSYAGQLGVRIELGPELTLTVRSELDLQGGVALRIRPGEPIETLAGFEAGDGTPARLDGAVEAVVERTRTEGDPVLLVGSADGTRLQFRGLAGGGGVRLDSGGTDVYAELRLHGLEFVLSPQDADGFIASVLPRDGFTLGADLTVAVSHRDGFSFRGNAALEVRIPTRLELGPVRIQALGISATPSPDALPIALGATFRAALGPVQAVVEEIGLTALLAFRPDHDGNLGPVDLDLGFKPPKGAGLSVDAGIVKGGGYLSFDPDRGEYAGALELDFAGIVAVKAIGLISTRMPDGSSGFSLLVIIAAEFGGGGIQLGFGFSLLAVGGLIGLNRGMDLEALGNGVRSGAIESVMFPKDIVANAPRILSDLRAFFPPEDGTFLVGPMAKIGWGTPALLRISLGIVIEIPPGNIAVLGVLSCVLPTEQLPLVVIQVQFVGALEVDKSRLWFFARLFDSRILSLTVNGGMGLLFSWGDNPELVLSVGGFHPSFRPPALPFPVPERISVDILNQPGQLLRVSAYLALTSNTVQFGARAELRLGFDDFGIEGGLSFDALFRFSPFAFVIQVSAHVSLKAFGVGLFGISLDFTLEGTCPWRAHGRGSISLLFFEISADFDIEWGESHHTTLPPVEVLALLENEVRRPEGWSTRPPDGSTRTLVTLRDLTAADGLVLHPRGTLFLAQRVVPLDVRVDKIGAQRASDGQRFLIEPDPVCRLDKISDTGEKFPMAQFQDMDDAVKLSRPAYEEQDAGLELAAAEGVLAAPRVVRRSARYEQIVVDRKARQVTTGPPPGPGAGSAHASGTAPAAAAAADPAPQPARKLVSLSPAVFGRLLDGSSTSRSPLSRTEAQRRRPLPQEHTVRAAGPRYVVAYHRNNAQAFPPQVPGIPLPTAADFRSPAAAADALARWTDSDPRLSGRLHVIPVSDARVRPQTSGTWTAAATPAPAAVRGAEPVLLAGGAVLLAGGADGAGAPVATAGLFDPVTTAWTVARPLTTARRGHSATRLADGRVLVVGGTGATGAALASAELYDPVAGTWRATDGAPLAGRSEHAAHLLRRGTGFVVLVTGGTRDGRSLASAEVYEPATDRWQPVAPMTGARSGHRIVPLPRGGLLVVGGALATGDGSVPLAYCERYDPDTGTWTPAASLHTPRTGHQATVLADGRILVTGGGPTRLPGHDGRIGGRSPASAEVYDPADDAWTPVADMPAGRGGHRAVLLPTGEVLVFGGTSGPSATAGHRGALRYHPATGRWTATGALAEGRTECAALALADGRVLAAGGLVAAGPAAPGPEAAVATAGTELFVP
ncbi:hypothetical protein DEJ50_31915 [Streptomyces venezuelae]|uniref:Uncharacterized protein n=1 Tax=Streptomyces venezuelae TaxID=54571 RepID=A0A5P2DCE3_STRVZ|nr:DUF6603 domain-containing protein [Streptomyces venezuelae]QES51778.1 hypothetical protein DEJ50_31915 [Streptomyces venezuelae]